jgi:hypothetical protein
MSEIMQSLIGLDSTTIVLLMLWLISEFLGKTDRVRANGVFQLISQVINSLLTKRVGG